MVEQRNLIHMAERTSTRPTGLPPLRSAFEVSLKGMPGISKHDHISLCSFILQYSKFAVVERQILISPSLKYQYIVADKEFMYHLKVELDKMIPVWDGMWYVS